MALPTTADEIWPHIEKWPFGVLSFVTPKGESRSAGVMYKVKDRELYVLTGPDTWKAKHIGSNPNVSMTVTVQRLPFRIRAVPPAVITFSGVASVLDMSEVDPAIRTALTRGIDDLPGMCAIRIVPEGNFVTYGIGIPAMQMRHPEKSLARVPVAV
jgi:Pyridoxamine 5'-phosphate oxidase